MNRILTSLAIIVTSFAPLFAQTLDPVQFVRTPVSGAARMCTYDAGTITGFGPLIGQSNDNLMGDTLFLCLGDSLFIDHANDEIVTGMDNDPDPNTMAGIGYAAFTCAPTTTGPNTAAVAADPCVIPSATQAGFFVFTGGVLSGDLFFFNDGNLQTALGGDPQVLDFAPITFDALGAAPTFSAIYEGDPQGDCLDLSADQAFTVAYLNAIDIGNVNIDGCLGAFRTSGGLPELDGSDYTVEITLDSDPTVMATINGTASHDDVISFSIPQPGTYTISVTDGKSCGATASVTGTTNCEEVTFLMPFDNALPGTNECFPVTVQNFINMVGAQFTMTWDATILTNPNPQGFNAMIPALGAANFFALGDGVMTFSWDALGTTGITLPNDAILFELCFDVIGQLGDCSPLDINGSVTPIEVIRFINGTEEVITLTTRSGKIQVTDNPFFVLVQQDSLTCPSFDDGGFTVTVDQGTGPYTYSWNTVPITGPNQDGPVIAQDGGSSSVTGLASGTYQVTVTDSGVPTLSVVDTFQVLAGPVLGITVRDTVPTCFGFTDGAIEFIPTSDGFEVLDPVGYTFTWSLPDGVADPGNTGYIAGIPAESYRITVTDPAGCEQSAEIPLGQPPALRVFDANTFIEDASCTGGADGEITITASGGVVAATGDYTFAWSTGETTMGTSTTVTGLNPGQYCVTITDDNACELIECYDVGAVKVLSIMDMVTDVACHSDSTGVITVVGNTTGAPADLPYSFTWSANAPMANNTADTSEITGLPAGIYAVTMTDASAVGCQIIDSIEVVQPDTIIIEVLDFTNETCLVGNDGAITLGVTGGVFPYTYTWSHDSLLMDSIATGLSAGNYTIDLLDANNCPAQLEQFISAPAPPNIVQLNDDSVTCSNDTDGELTVVATPAPGTNIISINWDNGQTGPTITNLPPGQYIVVVIGDNACAAVDTAFVLAPDPLTLDSVQVQAPDCPGDLNGQIAAFPSGGTGPYEYIWSTDPNTQTPQNPLPGLGAGDYTVALVDNNGCAAGPFAISIVDPPSIEVSFSNQQDTSCPDPGTCDGQATATAIYSDGTAGDFFFEWTTSGEMTSGGQTSTAVQLCAGMQTIRVFDGVCGDFYNFEVGAPDPIVAATTIEPVSCNGLSDGGASIEPTGGTAPYDIFWLETGEMTNGIADVAAGVYNALITDANMCLFTQQVTVTEPDVLVLAVDGASTTTSVTCGGDSDGVIVVNATGGNANPSDPYQYAWGDGTSGSTNANLPAGTYTVTVTDFKDCTDDLSFTITEPDPIVLVLDTIVPPLCFGDPTIVSIDTVFGGANNPFEEYVFQVDNNGLNFPVLQPATVFAGDHVITVEDVNGCTEEESFTITSPAQITIDLPSEITVELGDSLTQLMPTIAPSSSYSYLWTPSIFLSADSIQSPLVFPEFSQQYTLTVVNANGCSATESIFVELDANRNVYIPNVFSPNEDGRNDLFQVFPCIGTRAVRSARVFDRWGGLLFEEADIAPICTGTSLWDGDHPDGRPMPPGVYVYIVEIEFLDNVVLTYRGDITLVR